MGNSRLSWCLILLLSTVAFAEYDPCRSVFRQVADRVFFWRDTARSPIRPVRNTEHGADLEERIRFYQEKTGRTSTERDVRRARIATSVLQSLKFDHALSTVDDLKPLYMRVHTAYHMVLHNGRLIGELKALAATLTGESSDLGAFKAWVEVNKISEPYVDLAVASGDRATILAALSRLETDLKKHSQRLMRMIAWNYDEYEASRSMLEASAKFPDAIGKRAKDVLERLTSGALVPYLFKEVPFIDAHRTNPTYREVKELITMDVEMANLRRWWNGNREAFAMILSLSPTDAFFHYLDKVASHIPWVNKPRFRAMLQFLQSERSIIIHYPDIQRIIEGHGNVNKKLEMLEMLNSPTNDILMTTFARRLDARKMWEGMKGSANRREDKTFYGKMVKAEATARAMGDLVLWHHPSVSVGVRTFMDLMFTSGLGYLGYAGYVNFLGDSPALPADDEDDQKDDEKTESAVTELTQADEQELKEIMQDWDAVLLHMQNDPAAPVRY